jgi:hypothetical protein
MNIPFDLDENSIDFAQRLEAFKNHLPSFTFEYLNEIKLNLFKTSVDYERLIFLADVLVDYSWEMLNTNLWTFVEDYWRLLYVHAILYKILLLKLNYEIKNSAYADNDLIKLCDMGLLMGGPLLEKQFNHIIKYIENQTKSQTVKQLNKESLFEDEQLGSKRMKTIELNDRFKLNIEKSPSIEHFQNNYVNKNIPVIIDNQMSHWPACSKWR